MFHALPLPLSVPGIARALYVGIDVAKTSHMAGFLSGALLGKHRRFQECPTLAFENSRSGYERLLAAIDTHGSLFTCYVILEKTGHYHKALQQYLQEHGIIVYNIHIQKRPSRDKSDKRDALGLANALYNQVELGMQVLDAYQQARRVVPASDIALSLRGLVRHRYELVHECTRRKNKLTAICDELFPEFTQIFHDPNAKTALAFRETFPAPADIANADFADLLACRSRRPSSDDLRMLQDLACHSIGTKVRGRVQSLCFEQAQLITELRYLRTHLEHLDDEIGRLLTASREGSILMSMGIIGVIAAAAIIANIGTIANFPSAGHLKSYFGWAPQHNQTGISFDSMALAKGGTRTMKNMMYLIVWAAIKGDNEWHDIYERLIPLKCAYDARKKMYIGKNKVIGRLAGQIIEVIFSLLKRDYDMLAALGPGEPLPEPILYDRRIHQAHRSGLRNVLYCHSSMS